MYLSLPYLVPFFAAPVTFFLIRTHLNAQINKRTGQCDRLFEQNHVLNPALLLTDSTPDDVQQLRVQHCSFSE